MVSLVEFFKCTMMCLLWLFIPAFGYCNRTPQRSSEDVLTCRAEHLEWVLDFEEFVQLYDRLDHVKFKSGSKGGNTTLSYFRKSDDIPGERRTLVGRRRTIGKRGPYLIRKM